MGPVLASRSHETGCTGNPAAGPMPRAKPYPAATPAARPSQAFRTPWVKTHSRFDMGEL
jgi:hypothetical protein